jgi:hypothetical protein
VYNPSTKHDKLTYLTNIQLLSFSPCKEININVVHMKIYNHIFFLQVGIGYIEDKTTQVIITRCLLS